MSKNILIGIAVLAVGAIAGWYVLGSKTKPEATPAPASTESTPGTQRTVSTQEATKVVYTDSGFSPQTISIKAGTPVTFTNESSAQMWVASAVHPTHQELPGFDQLAGVGRGGTYQYTFVKVGTWKYHNHMSPSDVGSVMVTE